MDMERESSAKPGKIAAIFKRLLVKRFDEHRDTDLYLLEYHIIKYIVKYIQISPFLSVSETNTCQYFNEPIRQVCKRASKRKRQLMMKTLDAM